MSSSQIIKSASAQNNNNLQEMEFSNFDYDCEQINNLLGQETSSSNSNNNSNSKNMIKISQIHSNDSQNVKQDIIKSQDSSEYKNQKSTKRNLCCNDETIIEQQKKKEIKQTVSRYEQSRITDQIENMILKKNNEHNEKFYKNISSRETLPYSFDIKNSDELSKDTFIQQLPNPQQNSNIESLRKQSQEIYKLKFLLLASNILTRIKEGIQFIEQEIECSFLIIQDAFIFNDCFLVLPFKYYELNYFLCAKIGEEEKDMLKVLKQFREKYEDNQGEPLRTDEINDNIIKYFFIKANKKQSQVHA